jgi:dTDP-glucose pyrophosphorylase/CBS domain-containing protein
LKTELQNSSSSDNKNLEHIVANRENFLIYENENLLKAIKVIDENSKRIVFLKDLNSKVVASLSDGDIRRYLLKSNDLSIAVSNIANYNFIYIHENEISTAKQIMFEKRINCLPILNSKKNLTSILFSANFAYFKNIVVKTKKLNVPVVIMAGGEGTRLKPYSNILPKPLIPIGNATITEQIIQNFKNFGCKNFYMIVNHKRNLIKAYFNELKIDYNLKFIEEILPLKTGGGLCLLQNKINKSFFMTNCDVLLDENYEQIYKTHEKQKNIITLICVKKDYTLPYGTIETNEKNVVKNFVEKPKFTFLTNTGFYIISPDFLNLIKQNQAINMTDIIKECIKAKKKIGIIKVKKNSWYDMSQLEDLEKITKFFKK